MAVSKDYVSVFFRRLLSFFGVPYEKLKVLGAFYWQFKLHGISSFTRDSQKGLLSGKKRIEKNNNRKFEFLKCVNIGDFTDMSRTEVYGNNDETKLTIGKYCSVSWGVSFFLGQEHTVEFNATYHFNNCVMAYRHLKGKYTKGDIVIGNDVWIASDVKILSGVKIGDGAVIGANSLVTKDVPKYAVYGGNPAKLIRMRFTDDIIKILEEIKWWDWPLEDISKAIPVLQSSNITALKKYYDENIAKRKNGV
jgi:acetyltransferase-like isoleucine patch superfamily enzyme